jgi:hypothetical protein
MVHYLFKGEIIKKFYWVGYLDSLGLEVQEYLVTNLDVTGISDAYKKDGIHNITYLKATDVLSYRIENMAPIRVILKE